MTPHYADDWLTVYGGDVRDVLPALASDSVDCVVTSPPYWGLRDYGTATWSGGDEGCGHKNGMLASMKSTLNGGRLYGEHEKVHANGIPFRNVCGKCGATRLDSQLGLEATPEEYVANLVGVFRELRRVLKPTGTCWLNLGDSYAGGGGFSPNAPSNLAGAKQTTQHGAREGGIKPQGIIKPKDLVGIPWRVAFALQADGWYLRSDIIWAKPNPMPESVTDRPTKAHEYLFLLSKSPRYYFDQEAVREDGVGREVFGNTGRKQGLNGDRNDGGRQDMTPSIGRNLRSVWTIATRPYPGAHFAVFPPELPERCIKAGSSERGVCPECGAPWERVVSVEHGPMPAERGGKNYGKTAQGTSPTSALRKVGGEDWYAYAGKSGTTGWLPSCGHPSKPIPAIVLDPFAGSGTVGLVANRLSRRAILIDLNPAYLEQQMKRNAQVPVGL